MWIALFLLALIPLFFYWQDNVVEMFPQTEKFFPKKSEPISAELRPVDANGPDGKPEEPGRWYTSKTNQGFVAWTVAHDGKYRLAVGCRPGVEASLQVTATNRAPLQREMKLNYQYGLLDLGQGAFTSPELVGAVAQFSELYLQALNKSVLAQFTVQAADSGALARTLQAECASTAEAP